MGGDTQIRKLLKESVATHAWKEGEVVMDPSVDGRWVVIEDIMTWLHSWKGPRWNDTFTREELVAGITERYLASLRDLPVDHAVICADEMSRVPLEKHKEQAARTAAFRAQRPAKRTKLSARAQKQLDKLTQQHTKGLWTDPQFRTLRDEIYDCMDVPAPSRPSAAAAAAAAASVEQKDGAELSLYPDDALLCPEGIRYRHPTTQADTTERLHLPRLLHSRNVRQQIWTALVDYLQSGLVDIPAQKTLILDHFVEGPVVFTNDGWVQRKDLRHNFGEGEMMCIYWACFFERYACVIDTIDTDLMPLAVHYLATVHPARQRKLLWRYWHTNHVDLIALTNAICHHWEWTALDFMARLSLSRQSLRLSLSSFATPLSLHSLRLSLSLSLSWSLCVSGGIHFVRHRLLRQRLCAVPARLPENLPRCASLRQSRRPASGPPTPLRGDSALSLQRLHDVQCASLQAAEQLRRPPHRRRTAQPGGLAAGMRQQGLLQVPCGGRGSRGTELPDAAQAHPLLGD